MNKANFLPVIIIILSLGISAVLALGGQKNLNTKNISSNAININSTASVENLRQLDLKIEGMFCLGCRGSVISTLTALPGVFDADADPSTDTGWAVYDPKLITKEEIAATPIFEIYPAEILGDKPYEKNVTQARKPIETPLKTTEKLNQLAELLNKRGAVLEPFLQKELDSQLKTGNFDRVNTLLNNFINSYE